MNNMDSRLRGNDGHKTGIFGGTPDIFTIDNEWKTAEIIFTRIISLSLRRDSNGSNDNLFERLSSG
jgi:hypothetical protein